MKRMMLLAALSLALCAVAPGCGKPGAKLRPDQFRVEVEDLVSQEDVIVKRLKLTALGGCKVRVRSQSGLNEAQVEADKRMGLMTAEVILVADLVRLPNADADQLMYLIGLKSPNATVGGPARMPVEHGKKASALVTLRMTSGEYPLGPESSLAEIGGEEYHLSLR